MVAALAIAAVTMSFKVAEKMGSAAPTTWYYISEELDEGDFATAANWNKTNNTEACISSGERPCQISVEAADQTQLASVLSGKSNSQVLSMSTQRKD